MITYDGDDKELEDYLSTLALPPRSELWAAVQEAYEYLDQYLNDLPSRQHPVYGRVVFEAGSWGSRFFSDECWVCLAGLRYLRKEDSLLGVDVEQNGEDISPTDYFLDALRDPEYHGEYIEKWLGVWIPDDMVYDLITEPWDPENPEHILAFLGWLLRQDRESTLWS